MLLMRKWGVGVLLFVTVVVMVTDFHTGRDVRLVYLLILPVSMAALFNHRVLAFTMAITAPFVRLYFFLPWNESHDLWIGSINASVRSIVLVFIVHFMNRAKLMYEYKQLAETLSLQTRIKKLESVLPICTYCKKIRNDKGDYEPIETYLHTISEAICSHGICPDCLKEHFPEIAEEVETEINNNNQA